MLRWKAAPTRKSLSDLEGRPCYIGLDLASKIDIAGNILIFPPTETDPLWHVHGRYYLPEARVIEELDSNTSRYREFDALGLMTLTDGEVIDFEVIKEDLREFAGRFEVKEVAYDPWQATQLGQEMQAEGLAMVEVRQTVQNLSEPMKQLEALVLQRLLAHGDCPILTWMASNVVAKVDAKDNIYPNKERPENKIDGVVALITGLSRAIAGGEGEESLSDHLENHGIRTL
jgi:phage terminase large subunit-like protein